MTKTCILVADGARARFLTLEIPIEPATDGGAYLVEHLDLVNPEVDVPERKLFSDRSGSAHSSPKGGAHALDDHREGHEHESARRFARSVAERLASFAAEQAATEIVLVAEPRSLGALREQIVAKHLRGVDLVELGENLTRRPLVQIQSVLALRGVVPAAHAPELGVFRPRGQAPASR
jgi:protein required for attachment to host cells